MAGDSIDSIESREITTLRLPKVGANQLPLQVLDEAYKDARVRLQMCSGSILVRFNDDKKEIFGELKNELTETYSKLKLMAG